MAMIGDVTITSLETIDAFDIVTGDFKFQLDELQSATISQTQDKVDITGKQGRKLNSLKRNKAIKISGTNGLMSGHMLETQTGGTFEEKDTVIRWSDFKTVTSNAAATDYVAVGTTGAEIVSIFVRNSDGTRGKKFEQGASVKEGVFTYNPDSKAIAFNNGDLEDGTEIVIYYNRKINGNVLTNMSDTYSKKLTLYVNAFGEDTCGNVYRIQFYIPKADFDGNFEITMGDNQTVHSFDAEALAGACGTAGTYFTYTIFGENAEDVA